MFPKNTSPNTREEALLEAKSRWGESARVELYPRNADFVVGEMNDGIFFIYGRGASWKEAFEAARIRLN